MLRDLIAATNELAASVSVLNQTTIWDIIRTVALAAGAIAAWFIPRIVASNAEKRETRRATIELIHRAVSTDLVAERSARLYAYRKFKEDPETNSNPYNTDHHTFEHDCISVLNFFDSICFEVVKGLVEKEVARQAIGEYVVGAHTTLVPLLDPELVGNQSEDFPWLNQICIEWRSSIPEGRIKVPNKQEVSPLPTAAQDQPEKKDDPSK